jgi:transcriptional regulator GlxA family with amidase domain
MTRARVAAALVLSLLAGCASTAPAPSARPTHVAPVLEPGVKNVGIVVMDDVFITEFVAPLDVYKHAGKRLNVFTVAPRPGSVRSYEGVVFEPDFHADDAPRIDVLVVPSGNGSLTTDLADEAFVSFVRGRARTAEWVTSHCWGAFTLGAAGCLDGRAATTFPSSTGELARRYPKAKVVPGPRFVVAGNVVTSNGGLAAFESALFVVEKLLGREEAEKVATGLVFAPQNLELARTPGS